MKNEHNYIQDIAEVRLLMERSSKFLSLSGLSGVLIGAYALVAAYIAYDVLHFMPSEIMYVNNPPFDLLQVITLAVLLWIAAFGSTFALSYKKAIKRKESFWNPTAERLFFSMAMPLVTGGVLIFILLSKGLVGMAMPLTLIFYGLALFNAAKHTYDEVKSIGIIEIILGLAGLIFLKYALLFWALGFGVLHIISGIYLHYRYER